MSVAFVENPEDRIFNYHGDTHSVTNDRVSFRGVTLTVAKVHARVCRRYRSSPPGVGAFYAAITPTVFHSAYLRLSLINDTVVLTP